MSGCFIILWYLVSDEIIRILLEHWQLKIDEYGQEITFYMLFVLTMSPLHHYYMTTLLGM